MKKIFNIIACMMLLSAASCSDWTKQEPLEFRYVTLQEKNPALYESYLLSIREYHKSEHPVLIASFDNKPWTPSSCAERLTALPDSVDYAIIENFAEVNEATLKEAAEIKDQKGIKTLASVDFSVLIEEFEAENEGNAGMLSNHEARLEWVEGKTREFLRSVRKVGLDGVVFRYSGKNVISMKDAEKKTYTELQNAFLEPAEEYADTHRDKTVIFEGTPQYLVDREDFLERVDFIIIPTVTATGIPTFSSAIESVLLGDVPSEKFVISVIAIDDANDLSVEGILSDGSSAIVGAASWVNIVNSRYVKKGVCVYHSQRDYYGILANYADIRSAISIMNPSPMK